MSCYCGTTPLLQDPASRTSPPTSVAHNQFLLERGVVSVLRLAGRLLGRGDFPVIEVSGRGYKVTTLGQENGGLVKIHGVTTSHDTLGGSKLG